MSMHDCRIQNCYAVRKKTIDSASKKPSQLEKDHMDTYEHWIKHKWLSRKNNKGND